MSVLIGRIWSSFRARLGWRSQSTRPAGAKPFQRSGSTQKDIAVLTYTNLLDVQPALKELVAIIVQLSTGKRHSELDSKAIRSPLNECAVFVSELAQLSEVRPDQAAKAAASLSRILLEAKGSLSRNRTAAEAAIIDAMARLRSEYSLPLTKELLSKHRISTALEAGFSAGLTIFGILKEASEAIPVPILKPIFASVVVLLQAAHQTKLNREELRELTSSATDFALALAETCSLTHPPDALKETITLLEKKLGEIAEGCQILSSQNIGWSFLQNVNHKEKIGGWRRELDGLVQKFQSLGIMSVLIKQEILEQKFDSGRLDSLPQHPNLTDMRNEYLPGSRDDDEQLICNWIDDSPNLVLWIYAVTGMGKSTLARHVGEKLLQAGRLAAAVFFDYIPSEMQHPHLIVELISGELGRAHPKATPTIAEAISRFKGPVYDLKEKIRRFIRDPLRCLGYTQPLIILMDGIDAWASENRSAFLKELALLNDECHLVRFIVLSRSPPDAPNTTSPSITCHSLPPVSTSVLNAYFHREFDKIEWDGGQKPPSYEVEQLARRANGLFIWAGLTCAMIKDDNEDDDPRAVFDRFLQSEIAVGVGDSLADLFSKIIEASFPTPKQIDNLRQYLRIAFSLRESLPASDFSQLAKLPMRTVERIRSKLRTLPILPSHKLNDDDHMIHPASSFFHLSVVDYFWNLPVDGPLTILPPRKGHADLAQVCYNILPTLKYSPSNQAEGLHLDPLSRYVVRYWAYHAVSSSNPDRISPASLDASSDGGTRDMLISLQGCTVEGLSQWARILIQHLMITDSAMIGDHYEDDQMALLMRDVFTSLENSWELDSAGSWNAQMRSWVVGLQEDCALLALCLRLELPGDDPDYWHGLGKAHMGQARHQLFSLHPVNNAIIAHGRAVSAMAERSDSDKAKYLSSLAYSLATRAERTGRYEDTAAATNLLRDALRLHPPGDPGRSLTTKYLAQCLFVSWAATGDFWELNECIDNYDVALEYIRDEHPSELAGTIRGLSEAYTARYGVVGGAAGVADLEKSKSLDERAIALPDGNSFHLTPSLIHLGMVHRALSDHRRSIQELNESIRRYREALEAAPPGHPLREEALTLLAEALYTLQSSPGGCSGAIIQETIDFAVEAIGLDPPPSRRHLLLRILRSSHRLRYYSFFPQRSRDLHEAIQLARTLIGIPMFEDQRSTFSLYLGIDLYSRFFQPGGDRVEDLDESIELLRSALPLVPEDNWLEGAAYLGLVLRSRAWTKGSLSDLQESISVTLEALSRCPKDDKSFMLLTSNLSGCYSTAFWFQGHPDPHWTDHELSLVNECLVQTSNPTYD